MTTPTTRDVNCKTYCILILLASVFAAAALLTGISCSHSRPAKSDGPAQAEVTKQEPPEKTPPEPDKETQVGEARVFELNEVSEQPKAIKPSIPHYPDMARLMGAQAKIMLKLVVDETGDVRSVKVVYSSAPKFRSAFEESAIKAAKQYKFKPAILDGKPVFCWATLTIKFKLN